jgi:hypothetical protein
MASLPWTNAEYEQIIGRLHRQGAEEKFDKVEVFVPQVVYRKKVDGQEMVWSRDMGRMDIVARKRTLMDCAIDGVIPSRDIDKDRKKTRQSLKAWIKRIESEGVVEGHPTDLVAPIVEDPEVVRQKHMNAFSVMNRTWGGMKSESLHKLLQKEPKRWREYHRYLGTLRETWSEIPALKIAEKIMPRQDWVVADFGCGEAMLSKALANHEVHSYDHVAVDNTVTACDIASVPAADESFDAIVLSLALMGANYVDYLKQAHRTLKARGTLFIAEPQGKWEDQAKFCKLIGEIEDLGFYVLPKELSGGFIYLEAIKVQ